MPLILRHRYGFCVLLLAVLLNGCATLIPHFEQPQVNVVSIKAPNRGSVDQQFRVGLRVSNPNSMALDVKGMSYELSIDGIALASGVTADIPLVAAYSEVNFEVPISVSLLNSLRLFKRLVESPQAEGRKALPYELKARIDVGGPWVPRITVSEQGEIPLSGL